MFSFSSEFQLSLLFCRQPGSENVVGPSILLQRCRDVFRQFTLLAVAELAAAADAVIAPVRLGLFLLLSNLRFIFVRSSLLIICFYDYPFVLLIFCLLCRYYSCCVLFSIRFRFLQISTTPSGILQLHAPIGPVDGRPAPNLSTQGGSVRGTFRDSAAERPTFSDVFRLRFQPTPSSAFVSLCLSFRNLNLH